jgi:hypothetical protein
VYVRVCICNYVYVIEYIGVCGMLV